MIDIANKIKTAKQFAKAVEDMDGLTEREKDVLLHLIRNGTQEIRLGDRNEEVSIGVCDDETKGYGLCLTLKSQALRM